MITIGADPEVILKLDDEPFSAEDIIGGTKKSPLELEQKGCKLQEDNVLGEFNVNPTDKYSDMVIDIDYCMEQIEYLIPDVVEISDWSWAYFSENELSTPQAKEFQCEPDLNAYTKKYFNPIDPDTNLRTAGGHIHIAYPNVSKEKNFELVKLLDQYLTLPSLYIDTDGDERRKMYGSAGAFRHKPYGLELRTLSNFWIFREELVEWVFENVNKAYEAYLRNEPPKTKVPQIINENNIQMAKELSEELKIAEV